MLSLLAALALMQQPPTGDVPPDPEEAARLEREEREAAARAEAARRQAEDLASEVALMQRQLVELGQRVGASEAAALEAQESLNALREEEAELLARLETNREALIGLLAAIQRIETQTPPAVLAAPEDAADAARAAALMAEVAPALQERADTLTAQIEDKTRQRSGRN